MRISKIELVVFWESRCGQERGGSTSPCMKMGLPHHKDNSHLQVRISHGENGRYAVENYREYLVFVPNDSRHTT